MEIDLNKRWVKIYRYLCGYNYKSDLPKSGCRVGWELIFMTLIAVCSIPIYIVRAFSDDKDTFGTGFTQAIVGAIMQILMLFLGIVVLGSTLFPLTEWTEENEYQYLALYYLSGYIILPILVVIICGIILGLIEADEAITNYISKERKKKKEPSFLIEWFKTKKEKSCPQIKWKSNE